MGKGKEVKKQIMRRYNIAEQNHNMDDFQLAGSDKKLFVVALTMPDDATYRVKVKIGAVAIE